MFCDLSRYTEQIYYISRSKITETTDENLLTQEQKDEMPQKHIEIFTVESNPFYVSELQTGQKRRTDLS